MNLCSFFSNIIQETSFHSLVNLHKSQLFQPQHAHLFGKMLGIFSYCIIQIFPIKNRVYNTNLVKFLQWPAVTIHVVANNWTRTFLMKIRKNVTWFSFQTNICICSIWIHFHSFMYLSFQIMRHFDNGSLQHSKNTNLTRFYFTFSTITFEPGNIKECVIPQNKRLKISN